VMELVEGACRVKLAGTDAWVAYAGGQSFSVGANTSFEIEVTQAVHYVCHFG
jgi:purine/pyrimidine-nucleoside phosphorylase